jgi:hypothetical protein
MSRPVLPSAAVTVIDPATGLMTPVWYQFFAELARPSPGWAMPTGTADRTAFDSETVGVSALARRVKALIDDDLARGLKGA